MIPFTRFLIIYTLWKNEIFVLQPFSEWSDNFFYLKNDWVLNILLFIRYLLNIMVFETC